MRPPSRRPAGGRARRASRGWWAGLSAGRAAGRRPRLPRLVGGLDGVPAWARDRANRSLLRRALPQIRPRPADAVAVAVAAHARRRRGGAARRCSCSSSTRGPGWSPSPGRPRHRRRRRRPRARHPHHAPAAPRRAGRRRPAAAATPRGRRAGGRRSPPSPGSATGRRSPCRRPTPRAAAPARAAGRSTGRSTGLAAARAATGATGRPRTTVVAHSYGTRRGRRGGRRPGPAGRRRRRPAGQPRHGARRRRGLEAPEVYDAAAPADPVSASAGSASEPLGAGYGATPVAHRRRDDAQQLLRPPPPDAGRRSARWSPAPARAVSAPPAPGRGAGTAGRPALPGGDGTPTVGRHPALRPERGLPWPRRGRVEATSRRAGARPAPAPQHTDRSTVPSDDHPERHPVRRGDATPARRRRAPRPAAGRW